MANITLKEAYELLTRNTITEAFNIYDACIFSSGSVEAICEKETNRVYALDRLAGILSETRMHETLEELRVWHSYLAFLNPPTSKYYKDDLPTLTSQVEGSVRGWQAEIYIGICTVMRDMQDTISIPKEVLEALRK